MDPKTPDPTADPYEDDRNEVEREAHVLRSRSRGFGKTAQVASALMAMAAATSGPGYYGAPYGREFMRKPKPGPSKTVKNSRKRQKKARKNNRRK